jgi:hypothetical protein
VVILPHPVGSKLPALIDPDINVINLHELFSDTMGGYDYSTWFFRTDGHWHEAGNQMAAIQLYKVLARLTGSTAMDDVDIKLRLNTYYQSLPYGWRPSFWANGPVPSMGEVSKIVDTYLPLENIVDKTETEKLNRQ